MLSVAFDIKNQHWQHLKERTVPVASIHVAKQQETSQEPMHIVGKASQK